MEHHFSVEVAKEYGVNIAILLNHFYYWTEKNKANGQNYYDGYYWTYNSNKAFNEMFPYMSTKTIRTTLNKMIEQELILTGNYNQVKYDRTLWYTLSEKGKSICENGQMQVSQKGISICPNRQMEMPKSANGNAQIGKPIPDIIPDIITDNSNNIIMSETSKIDKRPSEIVDMFNSICVSYIGKQKIRLTDKRRDTIKTRLKNFTVEDFKTVFENAESSDYLKGKISNFKASFDWLIANDNNFAKTLEGNYANRKKNDDATNSKTSENSSVWNGLDFSDLEIRFDG